MRVVILGASGTSLWGAPLTSSDVQVWAGASLYKLHPKFAGFVDRWFEIHPDIERLRSGWLGWAIEKQSECELQEPHPELEHSRAYPIEEITDRFGRYFTSTVAYMIARAIHEGATGISIFGVNMDVVGEYHHQRACCEYMIGLARGMGIEVNIQGSSPLVRSEWLYGYEMLIDGSCSPPKLTSVRSPDPWYRIHPSLVGQRS